MEPKFTVWRHALYRPVLHSWLVWRNEVPVEAYFGVVERLIDLKVCQHVLALVEELFENFELPANVPGLAASWLNIAGLNKVLDFDLMLFDTASRLQLNLHVELQVCPL